MQVWMMFCAVSLAALTGCALKVTEADFLRPNARSARPVAALDPAYTRSLVQVRHADGNVSHGLHLRSPQARATVIYLQGNGEVLDREGIVRMWQFERLGMNAWFFDRRGYGRSGGRPSVQTLLSDTLDLVDHVRERSPGPLVVHGFSLGTGLAAHAARHRPIDVLVIEGGTNRVADYIDVHLPWYLKLVTRVQVAPEIEATDTAAALAGYRGALLVAVGEKDPDTVPALSRRLFAAVPSERKELLVVPGVGHQALISAPGEIEYAAFLQRSLGETRR